MGLPSRALRTSAGCVAGLGLCLLVAGAGTAEPPPAAEVARLVRQLGSESFAEREEAGRRLDALGEGALPALRKALDADDAEIRRHAVELVRVIERRVCGEQRCLRTDGGAWCLSVSSDGKRLAAEDAGGTLWLWDLDAERPARQLHGSGVRLGPVAFSPDGKWLLSGCRDDAHQDYALRLWEVASGREVRRLAGHKAAALCLAFLPDGKRALSGGQDGSLRLWDVAGGAELQAVEVPYPVRCLTAAPDGRLALTAAGGELVQVWSLPDLEEVRRLEGHRGLVRGVAIAPDGGHAATGGLDRSIRLWELATGREVRRLDAPRPVFCVAFSPDGRLLLSGGSDQVLHLWDVATGRELWRYEGHAATVFDVAFLPGGRRAASAGLDGSVRLWGVAH
jgi:WD40 repeat protein